MKGFRKGLSILLVFALVITSMVAFSAKTTEAKVKSIKVAKKVTVVEGKSKTVKVKVKTTKKTSKKFTAKSSNKKIATVKVKKGKVVIKGKKAGKATITIKSKANKKKKKKIKVTVQSADITMNVTPMLRDVYTLSFSKKVNFDLSKLTVMAKKNAKGKYIAKCKVYDISTNDQKNYNVTLEKNPTNGTWLQFTAKGINKKDIVKEVQVYKELSVRKFSRNYSYLTDQDIDREIEIYDYFRDDFIIVKSITGAPAGVKMTYDDENIYIKGKIAKTGVYKSVVTFEDEMGTTYTLNVTFIVGSADALTVYVPNEKGIAFNDAKGAQAYKSSSWIYIAGGSGEYTVTPVDRAGIFAEDTEYSENTVYYWNFTTSTPGTYTGKFTVVDDNDSSISTEASAVVNADKATLVTGKVISATGKPIKGAGVFANYKGDKEDEEDFYSMGKTKEDGTYRLYVTKGKYDFCAEHNEAIKYDFNRNITANTTLNWTLGLYQVTIKSSDTKIDPAKFGAWYKVSDDEDDDEHSIGEGNKIFLKAGSYKITSSGLAYPYSYKADATVKVTGDTTVTATVTSSEIPTITAGTTEVSVTGRMGYWVFTPSEDDRYVIWSNSSSKDPVGYLFDEDGNQLDKNDDYLAREFQMVDDLEAGKNYILGVAPYSGEDLTTTIKISKVG